MRAAALSDSRFLTSREALEASPTVLRRCPAVADGRAARGYKRGCSGMFPGPSRQTPREPDLGNPYRVDLGTAMFGMWTGHNNDDDNHDKHGIWTGRGTQKHDASAKHDAHADKDIAAMEAEHEKSRAAHAIAEQNVRKTEEQLQQYGEQLQKVKNTHEEKKHAEIAKNEAEKLKRQSEMDLDTAHAKMKEEMARLKQLKPGTASHQTTNSSNGYSRN